MQRTRQNEKKSWDSDLTINNTQEYSRILAILLLFDLSDEIYSSSFNKAKND